MRQSELMASLRAIEEKARRVRDTLPVFSTGPGALAVSVAVADADDAASIARTTARLLELTGLELDGPTTPRLGEDYRFRTEDGREVHVQIGAGSPAGRTGFAVSITHPETK